MLISDCCGAEEVDNSSDYGICPSCKEHCEYIDEDEDDEIDFQCCDNCDLPDACSDFNQCAIKAGIVKHRIDTSL